MKQKKRLFSLLNILLLLGLLSCSEEDKSVFGDEFEVPELTDANTIQFTVNVTNEWKSLEVIGGGGRMAIEWGDGRLQKIASTDRKAIAYKYVNQREYRVRVWAEELDFFSVGNGLIALSKLQMGYLPRMKFLNLNSFNATPELDLTASCPNAEDINVGNWSDLERVDISGCTKLDKAVMYTNPRLSVLRLGVHPELKELYCQNSALSSFLIKDMPLLRTLCLNGSPRLRDIAVDGEAGISELMIQYCAFTSSHFLSKLPSLRDLSCGNNLLTALDASSHTSLHVLDCSDNVELSSLLIPPHNNIRSLRMQACNLNVETLNRVFGALPQVPTSSNPSNPVVFHISYYDNPGTASCDASVLAAKRWTVAEKPVVPPSEHGR